MLNKLPEIFTLREAVKAGFTYYSLAKLVAEDVLEKIDRGIYKKSSTEDLGEWTSMVKASKMIRQKNALCLISALVYHKLTEVIPTTVWLLVDFNTRTTRPGITLFRRRNPMWGIGIIKDGPILVTDLERTLVECLMFKTKIGPNETFYALKRALDKKRKLTTAEKIIERAKELGLYHTIQDVMETFIYE